MTTHSLHNGANFRSPRDLSVSATGISRALVIGSCLAQSWPGRTEPWPGEGVIPCDFVLVHQTGELPANPPQPIEAYAFQLIQIPLRGILPERSYMRLSFDEPDHHRAVFEETAERLDRYIETVCGWNQQYGLLTFVVNFMVPQQNPLGRLLPRYDLRNPVNFVERLNERLDAAVRRRNNSYIVDLDQIAATFGRRFFQDDILNIVAHGGALDDSGHFLDAERIQPVRPLSESYEINSAGEALWAEVIGMYRTLRQIDMVKLVAVDLDDTLWRGVVAEESQVTHLTIEGWPMGIVEALLFLKQRGVMLAILSKNDEARIRPIWDRIMGGMLTLEDFVSVHINWRPKAENMSEILSDLNILPRSAIFIDDNPVERASMSAAFPDLRVLGADLYYLRRILLWAPETQVAHISRESAERTEMVQAQIRRETVRRGMSHEEFLATLGVRVVLGQVASVDDADFRRAFELINKTNQFNTTGQRWSVADCASAFAAGTIFHVFSAEDRFSRYGLVGVVVIQAACVQQFVMSCRVVGLGIEAAVMAALLDGFRAEGNATVTARLIETDANYLCRDLFARCGFAAADGVWVRSSERVAAPAHVELLEPA